MRPLLGINTLVSESDRAGRPVYRVAREYADALMTAGGSCVMLPAVADDDELDRLLLRVDGLLLTGGDDPDLRLIGGPAPLKECTVMPAEKQRTDLELARAAVERGIPVLGICWGMQALALNAGCSLIQHIPEAAAHTDGLIHKVAARPDSQLAGLVGNKAFPVASYHHQAVEDGAGPWEPAAVAEDGVYEALEHADHPFAIGVQWHPERTPDSRASLALFQGLVEASADNRRSP